VKFHTGGPESRYGHGLVVQHDRAWRFRGSPVARARAGWCRAYPTPMRNGVGVAIDGRIEALIMAWVRRRWPLLRLVPARMMRPAVAPAASSLRRSILRGALVVALPAAVVLAALALSP
jgi:hypothetical protein